ncbi:hypothetical protein F7U66_00380 [Vibrio parahaemolyticus]|nr:hypothetical protein [Vibrio parahaemolyticus]
MFKCLLNAFFKTVRDSEGRDIDAIIVRLAAQTASNQFDWSYLNELSVYENTMTGQRVYPYEVGSFAV